MSFRDLMVWQRSMDLAIDVYRATESLPKAEMYGLVSQMRRAAVSVPSNIAEGHGRQTPRQRYKFLEDALGSICELDTQIEIATRLNFLGPGATPLSKTANGLARGIEALMRHIAKQIREEPKDRHDTRSQPTQNARANVSSKAAGSRTSPQGDA